MGRLAVAESGKGVAGPGVGALFPADRTRASVAHRFVLPVAHRASTLGHTTHAFSVVVGLRNRFGSWNVPRSGRRHSKAAFAVAG